MRMETLLAHAESHKVFEFLGGLFMQDTCIMMCWVTSACTSVHSYNTWFLCLSMHIFPHVLRRTMAQANMLGGAQAKPSTHLQGPDCNLCGKSTAFGAKLACWSAVRSCWEGRGWHLIEVNTGVFHHFW